MDKEAYFAYSLFYMVDDRKQGGEELHHEAEKPKSALAAREEEVLAFWNREKIFEQSLQKKAPKGDYVFYDGPPFANGLPHYGHLLQSALKDAIPRYRTMQGYRVARQWGWDCHGLPVENLVEKELGFKSKRDIEEYGIAKFNAAARESIMKDVADWRRIIPRMGRWADMEHDYKTMDASYTESVWWAFKNLYDRELVYEGFKAMHLCPRCGTTLSNFEVALGYQDIEDIAVFVKLPLIDEPGTSLLVWTTTPWTLPGNVAAAVNKDAAYVKVRVGEEFLVVAKELVSKVFGDAAETEGEVLGSELVGMSYEPPFNYFREALHKHKTHAWKVYAAPYVTLTDGTGVVHLAPAYGAEDLELAQKEKIPLIHHVGEDGKFIPAVTDFGGLPVKPKGRHKETDQKIVEYLQQSGRLFKYETLTHSYPHCWRCDTPLLNWAANSWFVDVQKIKKDLIEENAKVHWVPEHVGRGRFNNGLESAPDWAISRSRYWGAPIPVWRNTKTKEVKAVGSVEELLSMVRRSGNRYFVMRHGEARSNVEGFINSTNDIENHLTEKGKEMVRKTASELTDAGITMIVASPIARAQETAKLVAKELGLASSAIMTDTRLAEVHFGEKNGAPIAEWQAIFATLSDKFNTAAVGGETYAQVYARVGDFLFDIERRYTAKNILIVSHGVPTWLMEKVAKRTPHHKITHEAKLDPASWRELEFISYPHNEKFELDLHRPYIDDVPLGDAIGGEWKRVPDVFDCWFESGSMPFASHQYPHHTDAFNPKRGFGLFAKGYPAHFIAESIDQTRGWFYSLIVLGVALFGKSPYKAVVTNGLVLAEDGQKMSKRLKNYPDPMELVERYGADSMRYYLLSSAVIRGEDLRFSARGVEEVSKKLLMRLDNVRSFYELYAPKKEAEGISTSNHVLDRWILSRLGELVRDTTQGFEAYELDVASRPLMQFVDDLSTWYLRRSRDRFKEEGKEKDEALATLRFVLSTVARTMAPVMPFYAEDLYQRMKSEKDPQSVHLTQWPEAMKIDTTLLEDMKKVRTIASQALQLREKANIKIRQPLAMLTIGEPALAAKDALLDILSDEVNVKEVHIDTNIGKEEVQLTTTLTDELREEGLLRDLIRAIQDLRKQEKLTIADRPRLTVATTLAGEQFFEKFENIIVEETNLDSISVTEGGEKTFAPFPFTLTLEKDA